MMKIKFKKNVKIIGYLIGFALIFSPFVNATEGGIGRATTGSQVGVMNGLLPPENITNLILTSITYNGTLDGDIVIGKFGLSGEIDYTISYNLFTGIHTWRQVGNWSFGSSIGIPVQYVKVETNALAYIYQDIFDLDGRNLTRKDSITKVGDIAFAPLIVNYNFSENSHVAFTPQIYSVSGSYSKDRLANGSVNAWTFSPTLAYTHLLTNHNIELTGAFGIDFYAPNHETNYHNGDVARFDFLGVKRLDNGFGFGAAGGIIHQLEDDKTSRKDFFDGFRSRSYGLGPMIVYEDKIKGLMPINANIRWIHEFDTKNRPEGDIINFGLGILF